MPTVNRRNYKLFSVVFCGVAAHHPGSSPTPFLSLFFHCFDSVTGACSSYCMGACGWVARICQPWDQLSFKSWLPIVEAPGCLRHPTSILAMEVLIEMFTLLYTLYVERRFT